jgi:hypothetical protein
MCWRGVEEGGEGGAAGDYQQPIVVFEVRHILSRWLPLFLKIGEKLPGGCNVEEEEEELEEEVV